MTNLRVLDLFSGIGGISLGLERAGMTTAAFCEVDPFCREVLKKHWPGVPVYEDVRTLRASDCGGIGPIDVVAGGFPCQDISLAGFGAGLAGARSSLWFEMLRIIQEFRPPWVLIENVPALRTRGADTVISGLEGEGYTAEPVVVGAWAAQGFHRRNRVWIIATTKRADTLSLRPQRKREAAEEQRTWEQFEGLVQAELRLSVPTGKSGGVAYGIPNRMERIKSYGNAVYPRVVEAIGNAIWRMNN